MGKYFKEAKTKKQKLSDYLEKIEFKCSLYDEKSRKSRTQYIMEIIGDVEFDEETYKLFISEFDCFGGRYSVRTKSETIKGIYDISQKYPFLTSSALEEIWFVYIHDQFEVYDLEKELGKYIDTYGRTDEALEKYLEYVDLTAKEFDKQYQLEADKLGIFCDEYDKELIEHLQFIIKQQHISFEKVISSLPSRQLIDKDKKQLEKIMEETRIFFGACHPISYQMIESLATDEGLDYYLEQPKYLICGTRTIDTTFTKQEFLKSVKEKQKDIKQKILK